MDLIRLQSAAFYARITAKTLALSIFALALQGQAAAASDEVIGDVLGILKQRGILDDEQYSQLTAKNASYEESRQSLLERFEFSGDMRARHESFWFDRDPLGVEATNRYRLRYRLRLNAKAAVNDWFSVGFRIATGDDHYSSNQTLGSSVSGDPQEWDAHGLNLRRAYMQAKLPFDGVKAAVQFGKVGNPFIWKVGKDYLWDGDINPEGVAFKMSANPSENTTAFLNLGYFIVDEEGGGKDPHVFGAQVGGEFGVSDTLAVGGRLSYYNWRSLKADFITRNAADGNLAGGVEGGTDNEISVGELSLYARTTSIDGWPILAYGTYAQNFDAESTLGASKEDTAFGIGLEVGDKKRFAKLGVAYWEMEANAVPANFVDSDLFDGHTNREGFVFYGSKTVFKNTDLNLTLFMGEEIEDGPAFVGDLGNADRIRLQTDLVVKF